MERLEEISVSFYIAQLQLYKLLIYKFFSFPQYPGVSVVERQQAWYFRVLSTFISCCAALLSFTSPVISPLFLMKQWQVHVISLGMCPTTVKQLFRQANTTYLSCSLSSSQNVSTGSPMQGLHMRLYT